MKCAPDELAAMVATSMGPGAVSDLLDETLGSLRARYPEADVHAVSITFSATQHAGQRETRRIDWRVQANNESGRGQCQREAFVELEEERAEMSIVPAVAEKVAALLRGLPANNFTRNRALQVAQNILEKEERRR
jgi:hypothetical protein